MASLLSTIWALLLNMLEIPIFPTCFNDATQDEDGKSQLSGPLITSILFKIGVYAIIVSSSLFPRSFREPKAIFLVLYEFLATAFLLEFATACIWTPIDVLFLTRLPQAICHILHQFGCEEMASALDAKKFVLAIATFALSITFCLIALYVTDAVDFTILRDYGVTSFTSYLKMKMSDRLQRELPKFLESNREVCRCKTRRRGRSKSRANNNKWSNSTSS